MKFSFRAKNKNGEDISGVRDSADRLSLARELRAEDLQPLSVSSSIPEHKRHLGFFSGLNKTIKLRDKILFAGNLSSMITAGLSLSRALDVLQRQTANKYFKTVIADLLARVEKGESFSQALSAYPDVFSEVFTSMVAAGEESGNLPDALAIVREQLKKTYELRRRIQGAMIYPVIILVVMVIIATLMMMFLVPTLTATFNDLKVPLPLLTRIIIGVSNLFSAQPLLVALVFIMLAVVIYRIWKTKTGQYFLDYLALKLPILKTITQQVNSAIAMRTTSSLLSSGVSMVTTMEITSQVIQNHYYRNVITASADEIAKGVLLSEIFERHSDLFPILVGELTLVGEETGELPEMLLKGAKFYEEEVEQATKNMSTIIEPLLMVLIGAAVAVFVMGILSPMYSLTASI